MKETTNEQRWWGRTGRSVLGGIREELADEILSAA